RLPDPEELAPVLARVGFEKLAWTRPVLSFSIAGMALDFGGIAKEYAVDRAASVCAGRGIGRKRYGAPTSYSAGLSAILD
uniref:FAD:protein FMN transferase n=1 Tax=Rhodoblastus sp. TaxID=1962975 RepID=UPI00261BCAD2